MFSHWLKMKIKVYKRHRLELFVIRPSGCWCLIQKPRNSHVFPGSVSDYIMNVFDLHNPDYLEVQNKRLEGKSVLKSSSTMSQDILMTTKIDRR